jgi:hypothetical protein
MEKYFNNHLTSFNQAPTRSSATKVVTIYSPQRDTLLDKVRTWIKAPQFDVTSNNVALIAVDFSQKIDLGGAGNFPDHTGYVHPQLSLVYTLEQGTVLP